MAFEKGTNPGEDKINYKLEVQKNNKKAFDELIAWHAVEKEFYDLKMILDICQSPESGVLYMKSPRDAVRQFATFRIKDLSDVPCEFVMDDVTKNILENSKPPVEAPAA